MQDLVAGLNIVYFLRIKLYVIVYIYVNQQLKIHSSGIKQSWWVGIAICYGLLVQRYE